MLSGQDLNISIGLYVDDFEVCNHLGTSCKTHKLCAVYWVLSNLSPGSHSSLSSIHLAVLCKTDNVKSYGYDKVLEPVLHDLMSLEVDGIFVPQLGTSLKGTVQTIAALFFVIFVRQQLQTLYQMCQMLLDLKQIVELVVAPVHNDESIAYLESKISDHRQRYQEVFPNKRLLPKHHYIEHYPQLIRLFGPLVGLWTIRFEAKHSFFKKVIKHTSCFENMPLSLAVKHQFMIGYHLLSPNIDKPMLDVSDVSTVPLGFLKEELAQAFKQRDPDLSEIHF